MESDVEEYVVMLQKHPVFQEGPYDVRYVAHEWRDSGFSVDEADSWVQMGCELARYAVELRDLGVTPEQAAKEATFKGTIGYWFTKHIITAKNIAEYLKEPEKPSLPKPRVAVVDENGNPL